MLKAIVHIKYWQICFIVSQHMNFDHMIPHWQIISR